MLVYLLMLKKTSNESASTSTSITSSRTTENSKEYICANPENWTVLKYGETERIIWPIPYIGDSEEFSVTITDEELEGVKNDNGVIWFSKVMKFYLLWFYTNTVVLVDFRQWQATQKRNYMVVYLTDHRGFKPKYYYCPRDPINLVHILPHHVCCLYCIYITNLLRDSTSIDKMYSTKEYFDAVGLVKESMPQDSFKDLRWCMHFSDDWDDEMEDWWDAYYRGQGRSKARDSLAFTKICSAWRCLQCKMADHHQRWILDESKAVG